MSLAQTRTSRLRRARALLLVGALGYSAAIAAAPATGPEIPPEGRESVRVDSDSTIPQAKGSPDGTVAHKIPADPGDLDAAMHRAIEEAIKRAIEGEASEPATLREERRASLLVGVIAIHVIVIGALVVWFMRGSRRGQGA